MRGRAVDTAVMIALTALITVEVALIGVGAWWVIAFARAG